MAAALRGDRLDLPAKLDLRLEQAVAGAAVLVGLTRKADRVGPRSRGRSLRVRRFVTEND
jgi:hypothetical protein